MSPQFDFWGGSSIGTTKTVPIRQGGEAIAQPVRRRRKKDAVEDDKRLVNYPYTR